MSKSWYERYRPPTGGFICSRSRLARTRKRLRELIEKRMRPCWSTLPSRTHDTVRVVQRNMLPSPRALPLNPSITCSRRPTEAPNHFLLTRLLMLRLDPPHIPPSSHMFTLPARVMQCTRQPAHPLVCHDMRSHVPRTHAPPCHSTSRRMQRRTPPRASTSINSACQTPGSSPSRLLCRHVTRHASSPRCRSSCVLSSCY